MENKPEKHSLEAKLFQSANINYFQQLVSKEAKIQQQQTIYTPYKDTGINLDHA